MVVRKHVPLPEEPHVHIQRLGRIRYRVTVLDLGFFGLRTEHAARTVWGFDRAKRVGEKLLAKHLQHKSYEPDTWTITKNGESA